MDAHHGQGEFVLIVHEADDSQADDDTDMSVLPLLDALLESVSVRDAARIAAKVSGQPRDTLYALALSRQKSALSYDGLQPVLLLYAQDWKSTRLNSSHSCATRIPFSAFKKT